MKLLLCVAVLGVSQTVSAQFSLKKFAKSAVESVSGSGESTEAAATEGNDSMQNKINASDMPSYTCQKVYVTDENGNRQKKEDGTDDYIVQLVDNNGNPVSAEAAEAQVKAINDGILTIAKKVGMSTGLGALKGGGKGALEGLAVGLGLSVADLYTVIALKKDSNKQKKALELYRKSFDEEGKPLNATVDSKTLKELNISDDNAVSKSTAQIEKEINSDAYKTIPSNDSLDALLGAAAKAS